MSGGSGLGNYKGMRNKRDQFGMNNGSTGVGGTENISDVLASVHRSKFQITKTEAIYSNK